MLADDTLSRKHAGFCAYTGVLFDAIPTQVQSNVDIAEKAAGNSTWGVRFCAFGKLRYERMDIPA